VTTFYRKPQEHPKELMCTEEGRVVTQDLSDFADLQEISNQVRNCRKCPLSETRRNAVPGEGPGNAKVMFVGEGPGRQEDLEGRPFVGRAGSVLDELLTSIKLDRKSVYVANVVKCRPLAKDSESAAQDRARDRKPTSEEIAACAPYLKGQMRLVRPQIICTLGDTATRFILENYGLKAGNISRIHGRVLSGDNAKLIPMYHPAAALYTAELKELMKKDFKKLGALLAQKTLVST
jgi:DNA polymerase